MSSLLLPSHMLALLGLGLLIGQQRWSRAVIAVYAAAMLIGFGAIVLAYVPRLAEEGLLAGAAAAGLLLAWARSWPEWIGVGLAGAIGLALALDSPPEALSLAAANLELIGTAAGAIAGVWVTARLSQWMNRPLPQWGARILGSWIAASAVLVLALRFVR
jgi:hydrogenase/urease accessory protein HupE